MGVVVNTPDVAFRANGAHDEGPGPEPAPANLGRKEIKTWLANLLLAESPTSVEAQQALQMIRQIQTVCDGYVVASDILQILSRAPENDRHGRPYRKDRGYGLAAELIIQHTYKELDAIESKGKMLGPSIFRDYCTEIMDALFARGNARKGVEAPIAIIDWLFRKVTTRGEYWALYFDLAVQAIDTTVDHTSVKIESDERTYRAAVRARRVEGAEDTSVLKSPSISHEVLLYLRDLQRKISLLKAAFEETLRTHRARSAEQADDEMAFLEDLFRAVTGIEYHPFTGMLCERMGSMQERAERGTGIRQMQRSANFYELQADKEAALQLPTLAREHYKRAGQIYTLIQDVYGTQRVMEKAGRSAGIGPVSKSA